MGVACAWRACGVCVVPCGASQNVSMPGANFSARPWVFASRCVPWAGGLALLSMSV